MPRVGKNATPHQPLAVEPQTVAPLDDGTVALSIIQALIPLGLEAVEDAVPQEVLALAASWCLLQTGFLRSALRARNVRAPAADASV